jgi:hypothetical protein
MALTRFRYYKHFLAICDMWIVIAEDVETGTYWFPIRPSCLALRLDSPSQIEAIKRNWRIAPALHMLAVPTRQREDGTWSDARQTQCLPWREYAWWLGGVNPEDAPEPLQEKLLIRQRALMDLTESVMKQRDDGAVEGMRARALQQEVRAAALGEVHTHCPVCQTPLCLVIEGAHLVAGAEVEE